MGGFSERIKQWWVHTDRTQRLVTLGGMGMLAVMLVTAFMFVMRPRYETLYSHLSEEEQGAVATDLEGFGFHPKFDKAGLIEIPSEEKAAARMKLASAGKQPKSSGHWGDAELKASSFGETPGVEQERLKAINEGEIAKSIEQMDGVVSARVHLTIPPRSAFATEQKPATASVEIVQTDAGELSQNQGRTIASMVKNAVDGLDTKDIVVVNQHMQMLFNGQDEGMDGAGGADKKAAMDDEVARKRQRSLQSMLDGAFGSGAAMVTVHADVDMDASEISSVDRKPVAVQTAQQTESVSGTPPPGAGGVPGVNGNTTAPTTGAGAASKSGNYEGKSTTKDYVVSDTTTNTKKALGTIKALAINVVVDSARVTDPKPVEEILKADLGDKLKLKPDGTPEPNQPFSYKVTSVTFDKTAAKEALAASTAASRQAQLQQMLSMLPIGALLIVAAIVLKQIAKVAKSTVLAPIASTPDGISLSLPGGGGHSSLPDHSGLSNLLAQIQNTTTDGDMGGGGYGGGGGGVTFTNNPDPIIEVEDIKNRVHIPLEQLKKMAQERPTLVAMLIKSLILEERK